MPMKKILVGTDFSDQAEVAVQTALELAAKHGSELILVHAVNLSMLQDGHPYFTAMPASYFAQVKVLQKELREKLASDVERLRGKGVDISTVFVDEAPETAIVRVAKEHEVDLIVVGSHGRSGLSRFLLGSVSEAVAKHAECEVLIQREVLPAPATYQRVLVPTDFSEHSERALERATELVASGGEVELFHVWDLPGGPLALWGSMQAELQESFERGSAALADECLAKYTGSDATLRFQQQQGEARDCIVERAEAGGFDLVVMGTHGRKGLQRLIMGSVAQSALRHMPTSMYLVR